MKKTHSYLYLWRKAQKPPLTLKEVARRAGISYTTVWNLENGPEEKVNLDIKRKVARVLGAEVIELFPSVEDEYQQLMGEFYTYLEEIFAHAEKTGEALSFRDLLDMKELQGVPFIYHHRFRTLMDICPCHDLESKIDIDKILQQMTPRELADLYCVSLRPKEVIKHLNQAAKRLGLEPVRFRPPAGRRPKIRLVKADLNQAGKGKMTKP